MGISTMGYLKLNWTIGIGRRLKLRDVCRERFRMVYNLTKYALDKLCSSIKRNDLTFDKPYNDRSTAIASNNLATTGKYIAKISALCERNGITLSKEQVSKKLQSISL